jgi:hypothetical protein
VADDTRSGEEEPVDLLVRQIQRRGDLYQIFLLSSILGSYRFWVCLTPLRHSHIIPLQTDAA